MARLLIECTRTACSGLHTGIQRVVRRIIAEAQSLLPRAGFDEVLPVVINGGRISALAQLVPHPREVACAEASNPPLVRAEPLNINADDHLLLIDASWHIDAWPALKHAISQGASLHVVWHDLIPLQHPAFFPEGLTERFRHHLDQVLQHAHSIHCVSHTVRAQLAEYIRKTAPDRMHSIELGVQHPGADGLRSGQAPRESLRIAFDGVHDASSSQTFSATHTQTSTQTSTHTTAVAGSASLTASSTHPTLSLLAVGTLEPRKGHALLLDACEAIWRDPKAPSSIRLIIAGAPGWRVDSLLARLAQHPELGWRLFVFHDLSDAELDWCYRHASCLVYPSLAEGYGLPIAEAGWRGLPVLLSDTAIHREVAGPRACYFAPQSAAALEASLRQLQSGALRWDARWPEPGRFRRWRDTTAGLIDGLRQRSYEEG